MDNFALHNFFRCPEKSEILRQFLRDFVERECSARPHVCLILQSASQAYDEGSIPFTRSMTTATSTMSTAQDRRHLADEPPATMPRHA